MRMLMMIMNDIRFQWRHGFYILYILVCSIYLILLHTIPIHYKETVALLLTFSDPSALGLILAGGIVLLEKDQGIHDCLFVTPLRLREYLLAKAISLSLLSVLSAWVIHTFALGIPSSPFLFTISVMLTSSLFTLLSIGVVVRTQSVNGFILLSQLYALPFALPLLGFLGKGNMFVYLIIPTEGSLLLLKSMIRQISIGEAIYAIIILSVGNVLVYYWAQYSFKRSIIMGLGRGEG
jgi:fluoroquinolone transport system permease protein